MSYPLAVFGRSAHGIPGLLGPFDIWHCSYRLAVDRKSACPGLSCTPQPGQKRSRLPMQQNTGAQIICTGPCYSVLCHIE